MNRARLEGVPKYFIPSPKHPEMFATRASGINGIASAALGILGLVLLQTAAPAELALLLLVSGIAGGWYFLREHSDRKSTNRGLQQEYDRLYAAAEPKPSNEQMDGWLHESVQEIVAEGFRQLDLEREQLAGADEGRAGTPPLELIGLPHELDDRDRLFIPVDRIRLAVGSDKVLRSNLYDITVVYLAQWKLCIFQCELDMATGAFAGHEVHEFQYQFINTLSTKSDRIAIPEPSTHNGVPASSTSSNGPGHSGRPHDLPAAERGSVVLHRTTKKELRIGVAGDHVSMVIGVEANEQFGTSGIIGEMQNAVDKKINVIRRQLRDYGTRGPGGPGSTNPDNL